MNALAYVLVASGCAALSNLFFRKSTDRSSSDGYLIFFYLFGFCLAISNLLFNANELSLKIVALGAVVGILNVALMQVTARALETGPSSLTFAFLNSSAVFPGALLFLIFGSNCGFGCSLQQAAGMLLVLVGLFLGTRQEGISPSIHWLKYAIGCFAIQIIALSCIQGRSLLSPSPAEDLWFMPGQFAAALLFQLIFYFRKNRSFPKEGMLIGLYGGAANFGSTCLLLLATKIALPHETGILFPCFAVSTIILCNLWAIRLYKESFNFKTNLVCSLGIFVAVFP